VGSIPIHPRQISPILAALTAKVAAHTTNGFLNRLPAVDLLVARRFRRRDSRRRAGRQVGGQQRGQVGEDQDPRDLRDVYTITTRVLMTPNRAIPTTKPSARKPVMSDMSDAGSHRLVHQLGDLLSARADSSPTTDRRRAGPFGHRLHAGA